jgi:surfeit locus 1 family protein
MTDRRNPDKDVPAGPPRFRPGLWVSLITAGFVVLTVSLGNWQMRRAAEKQARLSAFAERLAEPVLDVNRTEAALAPEPDPALQWRRLQVRGTFLPQASFFIDNRVRDHQSGYELVTPFRLEGSGTILLVVRGWNAARADRVLPVPPEAPAGPVRLEGIALVPDEHAFQLGHPDYPIARGTPTLWPHLSIIHYREGSAQPVLPWVLRQTTDASDGLARDWPGPADDSGMHQAYAAQWYSFAAIALGLYVWLNLRRRRAAASPADPVR